MSIMGELNKLLYGKHSNPAEKAQPYYDQAMQMERQYYNPYIQQGQQAGGLMSPIYGGMAQDPVGHMNQLMSQYEPSEAYKAQHEEAMSAARNAAAAGGYAGAPGDVKFQTQLTDKLLSQDMQQWLQNTMGIQGAGLQGEQHMYDTGFGATRGLTGDLANLYGTQGQLAFQGQREKNKQNSDLVGSLLGLGSIFI